MSAETSREDPRHIFLEPECCADPSVGRCWAAHNEWPLDDCDVQAEATKYVRADLVAALERERDAATARAEAAEARRDLFDTQAAAAKVTAANAEAQRDAAIAERDRLLEALEIIAGYRQCMDNLMSNVDVARAALACAKEPSA